MEPTTNKLRLLTSAKVNGTIPVHKYESELTGLRVVLAQVEGPLVNGYFTLATEAHDDDGLPHTLEHLVFLGSERYPYKGVLDLLANRCLASGTNAWTDTDHTCYTMTTAGSDGFLELLPIYLDHVLYPTLSDDGYTTEVHHISGDGDDGGVVYCEMQGRENTGESLTHYHLMRLAYPDCGYSAETGGRLENLRTTCNNAKVRAYHAQFYRPENLTIIIAGQIGIAEVARAIEPIEAKILLKRAKASEARPLEPFVRPWQQPVAPLAQSQNVGIEFPSDEEDCGLVSVGWRGPLCTRENERLTACSVLLRYLSDTAVAPLQRVFVEVPDPLAAQVSFSICENSESFLTLTFESVPLEKIDVVPEKLVAVLKGIADGLEPIDMVRMRSILERNVLEYLNNLEGSPHDAVAFLAIGDALYGETAEDFDTRLNVNRQLELLQRETETFWRQLLKQYLIDAHSVIVRASPSIAEQKSMARAEAQRLEAQRIRLGPEGLQEQADRLAGATERNAVQPPTEMLTQVPIPGTDGMHFHPLRKWQQGAAAGGHPPGFDLDRLPCYAEAYDVHTNFVYMIVTLDTAELTAEQRPLLFLLLDLLTESPVLRADGTLLSHEAVVTAIERDTISSGSYIGLESASQFSCGPFSDRCTLMLQVEPRKYATGARWLGDLLRRTQFKPERVRVCASKITNAVSQAKRKGNAVVAELLKAQFYRDDSNVRCSSMLRQQKYLNRVLEQLITIESMLLEERAEELGLAEPEVSYGGRQVCEQLNAIREVLTRPRNIAVHVAADWQRLSKMDMDLVGPWAQLADAGKAAPPEERRLAARMDYTMFRPEALAAVEETAAKAEARRQAAEAARLERLAVEAAAKADAEAAAAKAEAERRRAAGEATAAEQIDEFRDMVASAVEAIATDFGKVSLEATAATTATTTASEESAIAEVATEPEKANTTEPHLPGVIVALGCIESTFLYHATPAISSFDDPDLPALMLFLQYLTQLEGPLWRQIRGKGYAYGYNLMPRPNEGLLYFTLYRANNVFGAYLETKRIVQAQLDADAQWDETLLASAKSSLIFEIIEREKTVGHLVAAAMLGTFKGVPVGHNRELVAGVNAVQVADLRRVGELYVTKLFDAEDRGARTAIVCHPDKMNEVAEQFALINRQLKMETSLEESILGRCEA